MAEYAGRAEKVAVLECQNHVNTEQGAEDGPEFFFDHLLPGEVMLPHCLSQTVYPWQETVCVAAVLFVFRAEFFTEETLFFKHDAHVYQ